MKHRYGRSLVYQGHSPEMLRELFLTLPLDLSNQRTMMKTDNYMLQDALKNDMMFDEDIEHPMISEQRDQLGNYTNELVKEFMKNPSNAGLGDKLLQAKSFRNKMLSQNTPYGQAVLKYQTAQKEAEEIAKNTKGDPGYKQKLKRYIIDKRIKSTPEEFQKEFIGGRAADWRDPAADFLEYAKSSGYGKELSKFKEGKLTIEPYTASNGISGLKIIDKGAGITTDNLNNLNALLRQFQMEYSDPNTDRGAFREIAELPMDYINKTLINMSTLSSDKRYASQPSYDGRFMVTDKGDGSASSRTPKQPIFPVTTGERKFPEKQKELDNNMNMLSKGIINGEFSKNNFVSDVSAEQAFKDFFNKASDTFLPVELLQVPKHLAITYSKVYDKIKNWDNLKDSEKAETVFDYYKAKYKTYYDETRKEGEMIINGKPLKKDQAFIELVRSTEQAKTATTVPNYNLNTPEALQNVIQNIADYELPGKDGEVGTFIKTTPKGKESFVSINQVKNSIKNSSLELKDISAHVDENGNFFVKIPQDKASNKVDKYYLNPEALPTNIKKSWNFVKDFEKEFYDLSKSPEQIQKFNQESPFIVQTSEDITHYVKGYIDPNAPINREIIYGIEYMDYETNPDGELKVEESIISLNSLYEKALGDLFKGLLQQNKP